MKIILIISLLVPFVFFGYLMLLLDNFLASNAVSMENAYMYASAIVLGNTELAKKTIQLLEGKGYHVIHLADAFQVVQERKLVYLFALSENDADNIAFYKIGKKLYCIEKMISICNDKRNENMFISEKISYLLYEKVSADELFNMVLHQQGGKL